MLCLNPPIPYYYRLLRAAIQEGLVAGGRRVHSRDKACVLSIGGARVLQVLSTRA